VLSLIGNIAPMEVLLIAILAVIVFGKRLPSVAGQVYAQFRRARGTLDRLRRESGIEQELRDIERSVREAEWRKNLAEPSHLPATGAPEADGALDVPGATGHDVESAHRMESTEADEPVARGDVVEQASPVESASIEPVARGADEDVAPPRAEA
jgi:Sec-independent protein translocase protein TatA